MSAIGAIGLTLRTLFGKDDEYDVDDCSEENFLTMLKTAIKEKLITFKDAAILTQAGRDVDHMAELIAERQAKGTSSGNNGGGSGIKTQELKELEQTNTKERQKSSDDGRGIE